MEKKKGRVYSLRKGILYLIIGIILFQIFIMASVIGLTGTAGKLDKSSISVLSNSLNTKANEINAYMEGWSDISESVVQVQNISKGIEQRAGASISQLDVQNEYMESLLKESVPIILKMLRKTQATDAFIILDNKGTSDKYNAVMLRNNNPRNSIADNRDILVEAGMGEDISGYGFTLDSLWSMKVPLNKEEDFLAKPMYAGNSNPDMEAMDLGYWSSTFRMREKDTEVITYTVPLLDSEHFSYGVIGVGISLDYLRKVTMEKGIRLGGQEGYLLAVQEESDRVRTVFAAGRDYKTSIPPGSLIGVKQEETGLYLLEYDRQKEKDAAAMQKLNLYDRNTPFVEEEWIMAGLMQSSTLYYNSRHLRLMMLLAFIVSTVFCMTGAFILVLKMTNPIKMLMKGIGNLNPNDPYLPKTGIQELDELSKEIEMQSSSIFKEGARISDIVSMSGMEMGIFEYTEGTDYVFCTKELNRIVETNFKSWKNNYARAQEFRDSFEDFRQRITKEDEEENIYRVIKKDGKISWLKIKVQESENRTLGIFLDVTSDMQDKQKMKHERDYDVLTNLYNRRAFVREVNRIIEEGGCEQGVLSTWDLDNLKFVNDTYGHDMGDQYIRLMARAFTEVKGEGTLLARLSGDEFMLFMYNHDVTEIRERMKDVHRHFLQEKMILPDGGRLSVSVSAGMAIYKKDGDNYADLAKYADFAMYEVKKKSKGGINSFDRNSYLKNYILVQGVGELNRILNEKAIRYVFQPIVDVKEKKVFAYEALMRIDSELLKGPGELLRLAESQSKLGWIESITWSHAINEYAEWQPAIRDKKLFLNSLPNQCLSETEFKELEKNYGDILQNVVMEITENSETDMEIEELKYQKCAEWNISIAMDDYGTGYSNSDMLLTRKMDYVKIDMSIIRNVDVQPAKQKFMKSIIELCHENGMKVIAEGVENKNELQKVILLGTDYVQGYYLARPDWTIKNIDDMIRPLF